MMRILFFGKTGCAPCARTRPQVEGLAGELGVEFVYHDVADPGSRSLAESHGFRAVPAVVVEKVTDEGPKRVYRAAGGLLNLDALKRRVSA